MSKAIKVLDKIEDVVLVLMFAVMVLVIFFQVIMRYIFNNSLPWSEELGKFLFVWISWIGISIGHRRGEHIKIELLTGKLPYKAAQICNMLSELVVIWICAVTAYYGVIMTISQNHVNYAGIKISMSWGYVSVTVGCVLMVLRCIIAFVQSIQHIKRGKPPETPEEEIVINADAIEGGNA